MNREEVVAAVAQKGDGRIPLWCHWYAKETEDKYGDELEELVSRYPDDIIVVDFLAGSTRAADHPYWYGGEDEFGCQWATGVGGVGAFVVKHPLKEWEQLDDYLQNQFPKVNGERDRFLRARVLREKHPDKYLLGRSFRLFFERMHFLRGMDNLFVDLFVHRDKIDRLAAHLANFTVELAQGWKQVGVDGIILSDDWGFQDRLMINPDMWREIFKPWYKKMFQAVKDLDLQLWFHSCGNIAQIVGDLIECGIDVLNPLQPQAMDLKELSRQHKGRVCFNGGIDAQGTLITGTPQQVRDEVRMRCQSLGSKDGGYIGGPSTTIMPETPLDNIAAMCEAFREFR